MLTKQKYIEYLLSTPNNSGLFSLFGVNYSGRSTTIKMAGQWKGIEAGE